MGFLFADGFDFYSTLSQNWDGNGSISVGNGRLGSGNALNTGGSSQAYTPLVTPVTTTIIVGFAYYTDNTAGNTNPFFHLLDNAGNTQVQLRLNNRLLEVLSSGTQRGSSASVAMNPNTWNYIELKVVIGTGTSGAFELRLNGITVTSATGISTVASSNANVGSLYIRRNSSNTELFDDLYVLDTSGTQNNNFLGDVFVRTQMPTGAGTNTSWTPSTGANWSCVDETPSNDDTDYVSSGTPGQVDSYAIADLPSNVSQVFAVIPILRVRKDDSGTRTVRSYLLSGGTSNEGPDIGVPSSYSYFWRILETNPNTGVAWTAAAVNALEAGVKEIA